MKILTTLFMMTGARISELRTIKVSQVLTLLYKQHIIIDRMKRGRANSKAFLTKKGKQLLLKYRSEFVKLIELNRIHIPETPLNTYHIDVYNKLYFFSPEKSKGKLPYSRPHFTDKYNKLLQAVEIFKQQDKRVTSHSLRHGCIYSLWTKTEDIKFVQAIIGHLSINTTTHYADHMTDEEKKEKMENL